jgi:hypothetical protein
MTDLFFTDSGSAGFNVGDDLPAHWELADLEFCRQLILSQSTTEPYFGKMLADVVFPALHERSLSPNAVGAGQPGIE